MEMGEQCSIMNEGSESWIFKFKKFVIQVPIWCGGFGQVGEHLRYRLFIFHNKPFYIALDSNSYVSDFLEPWHHKSLFLYMIKLKLKQLKDLPKATQATEYKEISYI